MMGWVFPIRGSTPAPGRQSRRQISAPLNRSCCMVSLGRASNGNRPNGGFRTGAQVGVYGFGGDFVFPAADDEGGDAVADQVGDGAALAHEAVQPSSCGCCC